jgi:hypothetical protein
MQLKRQPTLDDAAQSKVVTLISWPEQAGWQGEGIQRTFFSTQSPEKY